MQGTGEPQVFEQDGVTIVAYGPEFERITEDCIPRAAQALLKAAEAPTSRLIVDLSHTRFFGSSLIEVLFRAWNRLQQRPGAQFALCGLTPYCAEIIQITNLDRLWGMYPTREAALEALRPQPQG